MDDTTKGEPSAIIDTDDYGSATNASRNGDSAANAANRSDIDANAGAGRGNGKKRLFTISDEVGEITWKFQ